MPGKAAKVAQGDRAVQVVEEMRPVLVAMQITFLLARVMTEGTGELRVTLMQAVVAVGLPASESVEFPHRVRAGMVARE